MRIPRENSAPVFEADKRQTKARSGSRNRRIGEVLVLFDLLRMHIPASYLITSSSTRARSIPFFAARFPGSAASAWLNQSSAAV